MNPRQRYLCTILLPSGKELTVTVHATDTQHASRLVSHLVEESDNPEMEQVELWSISQPKERRNR